MHFALLVPLADVRQDLVLGKVADGLLDELVLVGQAKVDGHRYLDRREDGVPSNDATASARGGRLYSSRMSDTPDSLDLAALADGHLTPVLGRYFERSWSHGIGHRLYDTAGKAYLDFANGIAVTALGHAHPAVTAAIHAQVDKLIGPTGAIGYSEPVVRLVDRLAASLPDPIDSIFLLNSGSEAIDGAMKLVRRVTGRPAIIAFAGAFHGRTYGATSMTSSSPNYRRGYDPMVPSIYFAPFPQVWRDFDGDEDRASEAALDHLRTMLTSIAPASSVAAIFVEPVLGEGGYVPGLDLVRDEQDPVLIADLAQPAQEGDRTWEVATFAQDRLDKDRRDA